MSVGSSIISYESDDDSNFDDDFIFMEYYDEEFGDMLMINYFNLRSIMNRVPCRTSSLTGRMFLLDALNGNPYICHQNFRMQKHVFLNFCDVLKGKGLLNDGRKVSVEEGVAMFLMIIGHTTRYSIIADHFQHSHNTISKWFRRVLRAVYSLGTEIIRPTDRDVIHERLVNKYPYFKDCIGAIDEIRVAAWVPASRQTSFHGRKTNITQNVMVTCDFDMKFIFEYAGWEGADNDSRVFIDTVKRTENNFPMPRGDQYYLVDAGYPNMPAFLAPYRGRRYH